MRNMTMRILVVCAVYLSAGIGLGLYRHGHGRGGWEGIRFVLYPALWPVMEYELWERRRAQAHWEKTRRAEMLAGVCPPGYRQLFSRHFLDGGELPSYHAVMAVLKESPPGLTDPLTGYVLAKLGEAAAAVSPQTVLEDAEALLAFSEAGPERAAAAAAAARGVFVSGRGDRGGPEAQRAVRCMLEAYGRVLPHAPEAELPYAVLALGTVYEAAGRLLPQEDAAGMFLRAKAEYGRAVDSGVPGAALSAAVFLSGLAADETERAAAADRIFAAFAAGSEDPAAPDLDEVFGRRNAIRGNPDGEAADRVPGRILFPALDSGMEQAVMEAPSLAGGKRWAEPVWRDFVIFFTRPCRGYSARAALTEDFLARLLPPDDVIAAAVRADGGCGPLLEVHGRLYAETGDSRWLEARGEVLLRLRPSLREFSSLFAAEAAFLRGEYRSHFLLAAKHLLLSDSPRLDDVSPAGYLKSMMEKRDIASDGGQGRQPYTARYVFFTNEIARAVYYGETDEKRSRMLEKIGRGEWPLKYYEFADSDVGIAESF